MRHPADRLAALSDASFAAFVDRLGAVWPGYESSVSPVSPDGVVELSLVREHPTGDRDPQRAVVRVTRTETTVEAVNDFAVFAAERGLTFAVLATVDDVSPAAEARARAAPVEVYDGVGLVSLAREAAIDIPGPSDSGDGVDSPNTGGDRDPE